MLRLPKVFHVGCCGASRSALRDRVPRQLAFREQDIVERGHHQEGAQQRNDCARRRGDVELGKEFIATIAHVPERPKEAVDRQDHEDADNGHHNRRVPLGRLLRCVKYIDAALDEARPFEARHTKAV